MARSRWKWVLICISLPMIYCDSCMLFTFNICLMKMLRLGIYDIYIHGGLQ